MDNQLMPTATNEELLEVFGKQLDSKRPVVFHVGEPREGRDGNMYQQMYIAQKRNLKGTAQSVESTFLGWSTDRIVRCIQNAIPDILDAKGIKAGSILPQPLNVEVRHYDSPQYETQEPRKYPMNSSRAGEPITHQGNLVYEYATLVSRSPEDDIWDNDPIDASVPSVKVDRVSEAIGG